MTISKSDASLVPRKSLWEGEKQNGSTIISNRGGNSRILRALRLRREWDKKCFLSVHYVMGAASWVFMSALSEAR
jgi:hypothetical protein